MSTSTLVLTETESQSRGSASSSEVGKISVDEENKGWRGCNTQVRPWDAAQQETAAGCQTGRKLRVEDSRQGLFLSHYELENGGSLAEGD